jgi:cellulose synthase/poly-beta-1,6-N-acetylglucosamine synthase-like glycosyltransferase
MNDSALGTSQASISAIVPARNEQAVIAACVNSLAAQPEIAEIVVVDDQSADRTAEIVESLASQIPQLRLLTVQNVPRGWLGKNNAAWLGAQQGGKRWLLFTDADAELLPQAAARALQVAEETNTALVSFSPEQVTKTWYEKSLIPFVYCRLARYFSYQEINDSNSSAAAANGQFLMIRRDAYDAVGGHGGVAGEVLEDVALARLVKSLGYRIWFAPGKGIVRVRMYRSFAEMWRGWKKSLYLLVGGSPAALYRELFSVVPWIPLLLVILALKYPLALVLGAGLLLARHAAYGMTLASNQYRLTNILYYMPGVLLYGGVLWASYRAHRAGTVEWKGRKIG